MDIQQARRAIDHPLGSRALLTLKEMREKGEQCDTVLRSSDGKSFRIHRTIMATCSSYFRVLFTNNWGSEPSRTEYTIDAPGAVLHIIIDWTYLRTSPKVDWETARELLHAADQFNIVQLISECCVSLFENINPKNCMDLYSSGCMYSSTPLKQKALEFILNNFDATFMKNDEFLQLSHQELSSILCSDFLDVRQEFLVWDVIVRWIEFEPKSRKRFLNLLLKCIRFNLVSSSESVFQISDHPLIQEDHTSKKYLQRVSNIYTPRGVCKSYLPKSHRHPQGSPRISRDLMLVYGGWQGERAVKTLLSYDPRGGSWKEISNTEFLGPRSHHQSVVMGFRMYVLGGILDGNEYLRSCASFDALTREWKDISPMNECRAFFAASVLDNRIYALGGYDGQYQSCMVECYHPDLNQWFVLPPMLQERSDFGAASSMKFIYVVGGFNGIHQMNTAEMFDVETNQWTLLPPMISIRCAGACVIYDGKLYALGGYNGKSRMRTCEKLDLENHSWAQSQNMNNMRSYFSAAVVDDQIYVVGGVCESSMLGNVERYNSASGRWRIAKSLPNALCGHTSCVIRDLPNRKDYLLGDRGQHKFVSKNYRRSKTLRCHQGNKGPYNIPMPNP